MRPEWPDKIETREEFERLYAEASTMTVEQMHEYGLQGKKCNCGVDCCHGWCMGMAEEERCTIDATT